MKKLIKPVFIVSFLLFTDNNIFAKTIAAPNDSLIAKQVSFFKDSLKLSDDQAAKLYKFIYVNDSSSKKLDEQNLSSGERTAALTEINDAYNNNLKLLFTTEQWNKYQQMLERRRQEMLNRTRNKNIKIKELQ